MPDIEKMLKDKGAEIENLKVPEELESRLRNALSTKAAALRPKNKWKGALAAGFILLLFMGYHFDALAYYGKKLVGYDQVMNGTLNQLNELGKGQVIGKSYTSKTGATVTLDGIMLDENQLLVFCTVKSKDVEKVNLGAFTHIKGAFKRYYNNSSYGMMSGDKTEIKYVISMETPHFYEKNMRFEFTVSGEGKEEPGSIPFKLDWSKAMGHTLKKDLNKTIKVDETKIHLDSIVASPTKTVIEGSLQNIVALAKDQLTGERFRPNVLNIKLSANGKAVPLQGGGMSTDMKGITFHQDYDALPTPLKTLKIELVSFGADHDVNQQVEIQKDRVNQPVNILGQDIKINKVYESEGDTYVTITTEESVILTRVYLMADGQNIELKETISDQYDKHKDRRITHTRTLHFPGTGNDLALDIQRMTYSKNYNKVIDIPIN